MTVQFLEAKLKAKYGALPNQKQLLEKRMRQGHGGGEKKHFDSVSSSATATARPGARLRTCTSGLAIAAARSDAAASPVRAPGRLGADSGRTAARCGAGDRVRRAQA